VWLRFGTSTNILRALVPVGPRHGGSGHHSAEDVLALKPDGRVLSNGPGDPEPLPHAGGQHPQLVGRKTIFGICLGTSCWGGARRHDLQTEVGHRGANHPVLNRVTIR